MRMLLVLFACAALWAAPPDPGAAAAEDPLQLPPVEQLQVDAISYVEAQAAGLPGTYTFRAVKPPTLPRFPAGGKLSFEPIRLSRRELGGIFFVSFKMSLDGRPIGQVRVDLEGKWTGKLLRCRAALARKTIPEAEQFEQVSFEGTPPVGALNIIPAGYRLRAILAAGHILVMQDLEAIPLVVAGEPVRLEVVSGSLVIAVDALARSSGALGAKVRLEMPTSHKNVEAEVTGEGEARVHWAGGN